jgi:hypothetical protein
MKTKQTVINPIIFALLLGLTMVGCSHVQVIQPGASTSDTGSRGQLTQPSTPSNDAVARNQASQPRDSTGITPHVNYCIRLLTLGINTFWKETGRLPDSISELSQNGLLPANLTNPITNQSFLVDPKTPGNGDFTYIKQNEQSAVLSFVKSDNTTLECPVDSSVFAGSMAPPDSRVNMYMQWGQIACQCYYKDFKIIPSGINELVKGGYWPFSSETNPVTGEQMDFVTPTRGNIFFSFEPTKVKVGSLNSTNGYTASGIDSAQDPFHM